MHDYKAAVVEVRSGLSKTKVDVPEMENVLNDMAKKGMRLRNA